MSEKVRLQYLFDPLCGWCYASAPALTGLAAAYPNQLELMPSGLFSMGGGQDMTPELADYAWTNDQRIASMTGQVFSEKYHQQVLLGDGARFDSTMMNRALTAVQAAKPTLEPALLHDLQIARYVHGADTSRAGTVADITTAGAAQHGVAWNTASFAERLQADVELAQQTDERIRKTRIAMNHLGIRGVPHLLARIDDDVTLFSGASLYQGPDHLLDEIRQRIGSALPEPAAK